MCLFCRLVFFFFNDTATTEIYTLSLHDALPIYKYAGAAPPRAGAAGRSRREPADRKSTRLNSSHQKISYAVFCLKKKNELVKLGINLTATRMVKSKEQTHGLQ